MISTLAPVETGATEDSFAVRAQVRTEPRQKAHPRLRHLATVVGEDDVSIGHERVSDGHANLPSQMIVAGAREAKRIVPHRARLVARRDLDRADGDDAFQHARDQRRGDPIVAISPLFDDGDEPRLDELEKVLACGGTRDSGEIGKFGAGQSLTTHEGGQNGCARGIPDERCDLDQICGRDHEGTLPPSRHSQQATSVRHAPNRCETTADNFAANIIAPGRGQTARTHHEETDSSRRAIVNIC